MIKILTKGEIPIMKYECDWCGTKWIAPIDEEGVEICVLLGISYPKMSCPICKFGKSIGEKMGAIGGK